MTRNADGVDPGGNPTARTVPRPGEDDQGDAGDGGSWRTADAPVTSRGVTRRLLAAADAVAASEDRGAAEARLCERLVDSGLYATAWLGARAVNGEGLAVRAGAGFDARTTRSRPSYPPTDRVGDAALQRPLRTGEVAVLEPDDLADTGWLDGEGSAAGLVAAVPVGAGACADSVLCVHARRPNAFGELELAGLDALGTTLGAAVDALRVRDLFFAGSTVEVEVRVDSDDAVLGRLSTDQPCRLSLEGYAAEGESWVLSLDVEGPDPDGFAATAECDPAVGSAHPVVSRTDGGRVRLDVDDAPLLDRVASRGASVGTVVADHGVCRVTLELPPSGDVCECLAHLHEPFPDLEFLSLREVDRGPREPEVSVTPLSDLTDRQREALEAAYDGGYFEWPRANTAEEIAPELGITSSTLHWHLREAERSLVGSLLD